MKYEFLLFDADNTILDFDKSEERALKIAFSAHDLPFDKNVLAIYRKNNIAQWQRLERGEISVAEVLENRFVETFAQLGVQADLKGVSLMYEEQLHLGFYKIKHSVRVLTRLQRTHKLYVVSNGVLSIQNSRMAGSGLDKYFLKRFISQEIGVPKPNSAFFDKAFAQIDGFDKSKALIIGDSLTSDIQGGVNAGIDTCWFNPSGAPNLSALAPTYEIHDLRQLYKIVK